jgi:hypothetical protein
VRRTPGPERQQSEEVVIAVADDEVAADGELGKGEQDQEGAAYTTRSPPRTVKPAHRVNATLASSSVVEDGLRSSRCGGIPRRRRPRC